MHTVVTAALRRSAASAFLALAAARSPLGAQSPGPPSDTASGVRIDSRLDLPTVLARALAVNPAATLAEETLRTARSEQRVATAAYLPTLAATSNALRSNITTPTGGLEPSSATAYSAGLQSSVDLFTGGRRGADRARAEADVGTAEATRVSQRYAVTLLAERAFFEALRGEDLIVVANARVARASSGLKYAQDRVRAGTATKSDELRARLELTAGRQQLIAARDTLQTAAYALGRLVGADGPVGAARPATLEPRALALTDSEIVRIAVESAPAIVAAEATSRSTAAASRSARSQYAPDLRLTGGYAVANQTPLIGAPRPGWSLNVGTVFPIFNGFLREDAVTRAEASSEVARVTALDVRRQMRTESSRLLGALSIAVQNIALAADAVTVAREDLRVQTERYRAGVATALDRQTSELAVTQAELGLVAARYNYQVTRAALEALLGRSL